MVVIAKIQAKAGKEAELEKAFREFVKKVQTEEGALAYEVHRDHKDPSIFITYEKYKDKEALNNHPSTQHVQEFIPVLMSLIEGAPALNYYDEVARITR